MNGLLIADTGSGVGKTTVTLGIMARMRRQGLTVQPFKGGPDFLDTGYHSRIAGRTARNLDTWMLSAESKLSQFGYVTVEFTKDCLLGPTGTIIRGHSFHYSRIAGTPALATSYNVRYSLSGRQETEGFTRGNTLASYIHLHFRAAPHVARNFVGLARTVKARELATT